MKPELDKLCQEYISNRDAVKEAFRWGKSALHTVCANIFCARGNAADTERLKACRKIIKDSTGFRSKFRSKKVRSILAAMLSLQEKPEDRIPDMYNVLQRLVDVATCTPREYVKLEKNAERVLKEMDAGKSVSFSRNIQA